MKEGNYCEKNKKNCKRDKGKKDTKYENNFVTGQSAWNILAAIVLTGVVVYNNA